VVSENLTIMEAAERIKKLSGCNVQISNDIKDERNYKVSAEKMRKMGFVPTRKIESAYNEIKKALDDGTIKDYQEPIYSNYKLLYSSKEMQEKVFLLGI
jgi:hypothetical protein